ncbi:TMEM175 family protein [Sphingomonas mali]|uniref:TMEM175 family protein n=1 Tax=Sphingomonas mali TaxID=40682 RepID=UPI00082F5B08|nr:TMEM175 family protein [Sphingomonas mali]
MNDATNDHPMHHGAPAHALERLVFFSDAVFAISITLLVIELKVPALPRSASDVEFLQALANLTPHFVGFLVSFFVIGAFWSGHHRAFDCARHWSPKLLMPNLFLLCSVAGMPFFTALVSEYYGKLVPSAAYCLWLFFVAICNLWNNMKAVSPPVAADDLDPEYAALIRRRGWAVILGTLTALAFCFVNPWLAQPALISMPLWRRLLEYLHRRGTLKTV